MYGRWKLFPKTRKVSFNTKISTKCWRCPPTPAFYTYRPTLGKLVFESKVTSLAYRTFLDVSGRTLPVVKVTLHGTGSRLYTIFTFTSIHSQTPVNATRKLTNCCVIWITVDAKYFRTLQNQTFLVLKCTSNKGICSNVSITSTL